MIRVNRANLLKALDLVEPGLASKELIEQSTSFAFHNGHVATYNAELSIRHPLPELNGLTGAVNADELHRLVDKIDRDYVDLKIEGGELILETGHKTSHIKAGFTLHQEITLPLDEIQGQRDWQPLPEGFLEAITIAMASTSRDTSMPILTCIHVTEKMLESSDNLRATRVFLDAIPRAPFLLNGSSTRKIIQYPLAKIDVSEGWLHFLTTEGTTVSLRVFNGEYPNMTPIMKVEGQSLVFPERIIPILARAQVFALARTSVPNIVTLQAHPGDADVRIKMESGSLEISTQTELGWFTETTSETQYQGPPVSFAVHPFLLRSVCERANQCVLSDSRIKFQSDNWEHVIALRTE
jgi:hypothetical protein